MKCLVAVICLLGVVVAGPGVWKPYGAATLYAVADPPSGLTMIDPSNPLMYRSLLMLFSGPVVILLHDTPDARGQTLYLANRGLGDMWSNSTIPSYVTDSFFSTKNTPLVFFPSNLPSEDLEDKLKIGRYRNARPVNDDVNLDLSKVALLVVQPVEELDDDIRGRMREVAQVQVEEAVDLMNLKREVEKLLEGGGEGDPGLDALKNLLDMTLKELVNVPVKLVSNGITIFVGYYPRLVPGLNRTNTTDFTTTTTLEPEILPQP